MKLNEWLLAELEREVEKSRKVLERVPEGRNDWKPHEKSMPLGYLAALVAGMPRWIVLMIERDQMDVNTPDNAQFKPVPAQKTKELLEQQDAAFDEARQALENTNDEHLAKPWAFAMDGKVLTEKPRSQMIGESVLSHLAHHRGQLTVYLRLNDAAVPAIYGPSADEQPF